MYPKYHESNKFITKIIPNQLKKHDLRKIINLFHKYCRDQYKTLIIFSKKKFRRLTISMTPTPMSCTNMTWTSRSTSNTVLACRHRRPASTLMIAPEMTVTETISTINLEMDKHRDVIGWLQLLQSPPPLFPPSLICVTALSWWMQR